MNILSLSLFILSLIQCSQSVLYAGDLEIFWQLPDGLTLSSVRSPYHSLSSPYSSKVPNYPRSASPHGENRLRRLHPLFFLIHVLGVFPKHGWIHDRGWFVSHLQYHPRCRCRKQQYQYTSQLLLLFPSLTFASLISYTRISS